MEERVWPTIYILADCYLMDLHMEYRARHYRLIILRAIQEDCNLEFTEQRTILHLKNLCQVIAMSAIGDMLFIALYAILFAVWIVFQSYPLTLISVVLLFFILVPACNRRVSLLGIFLMLFLVSDLTFSSIESREEMGKILEKGCINIGDWEGMDNSDVLKREVSRYFGVKRVLFFRKSSNIIFIALEPGMGGMSVPNDVCGSRKLSTT